jgi:hypothetical protein
MISISSIAVVYSLGAVALAIVLVTLLHQLEPEFDPSWRILSEYSLGRSGILMCIAFLAGGTAVIAVAIALAESAWPASLCLILVAIGPLCAAFIDTDPITTPRLGRRSSSVSRWPRPSPESALPVTRRWGLSWPGHRLFLDRARLISRDERALCAARRSRRTSGAHRLTKPREHARVSGLGGAGCGDGPAVTANLTGGVRHRVFVRETANA